MSGKKYKNKRQKSKSALKVYVVIGGLLVLLVTLAVVGSGLDKKKLGDLPGYAVNSGSNIEKAYRFASTDVGLEVLAKSTCYCGCEGGGGHDNLLDCFISSVGDDFVKYDDHATNCGMCISEALDAETWSDDGQSAIQIKAQLDSRYGGI